MSTYHNYVKYMVYEYWVKTNFHDYSWIATWICPHQSHDSWFNVANWYHRTVYSSQISHTDHTGIHKAFLAIAFCTFLELNYTLLITFYVSLGWYARRSCGGSHRDEKGMENFAWKSPLSYTSNTFMEYNLKRLLSSEGYPRGYGPTSFVVFVRNVAHAAEHGTNGISMLHLAL